MRYFALFAAFFVANATAAVVIAEGADGSHIRLHTDKTGQCVDGARLAEWMSPDAKKKVQGCWSNIGGGHLLVALLNGNAFMVPLAALKEPKES